MPFAAFKEVLAVAFKEAPNVLSREVVPSSDHPLLNMSARKAAELIRTGQLKSVDLVQAHIERTRAVNGRINAATECFDAEALEQAAAADERVRGGAKVDATRRPLYGVPISIKHSLDVAGRRNVCGIKKRAGAPPAARDSVVVQRVREAGAIPFCYTNVPTACLSYETDNYVHGRTSNPRDLRTTPGGSSGGESALLAAQASLVGVGSDFGGSCRVPAALTGVYGHKPGRWVDMTGSLPSIPTDRRFPGVYVAGPMARYAEDLLAVNNAILGVNDAPALQSPTKILRMGFDYGTDYQKQMIDEAYGTATSLYNVAPDKDAYIRMPELMQLAMMPHYITGVSNVLEYTRDVRANSLSGPEEITKHLLGVSEVGLPVIMQLFEYNIPISQELRVQGLKTTRAARELVQKQLEGDTILVGPPIVGTHFFHNQLALNIYAEFFFANGLGLSSLSVPLGLDAQGYPRAFQLIGHPHNDRLLFKVAEDFAKVYGGFHKIQ